MGISILSLLLNSPRKLRVGYLMFVAVVRAGYEPKERREKLISSSAPSDLRDVITAKFSINLATMSQFVLV